MSPNSPFPSDGIRYQEAEAKYNIPAGARVNLSHPCPVNVQPFTFDPRQELEIQEVKFGFIPNSQDGTASRVRRRYRLQKGGNSQLVLVHYTRGPQTRESFMSYEPFRSLTIIHRHPTKPDESTCPRVSSAHRQRAGRFCRGRQIGTEILSSRNADARKLRTIDYAHRADWDGHEL